MLLELKDELEVGQITKLRTRERVKVEDAAGFSLSVLILLLHKYSSYVLDDVFLKVQMAGSTPDQKIELRYNLKKEETFNTLFRTVRKDIAVLDGSSHGSLDIEWVTNGEEIAMKNRIRLMPSGNDHLFDMVFSSDPHSFFYPVSRRASKHYKILASNALANPDIAISDLDYLDGKEWREMNSLAYGPEDNHVSTPEFLDKLFESTVGEYPNYRAVVSREKSITYFSLNKKANQLANVLVKRGVGPGDTVGILLNRSLEAYATMLAIMKCGAAYVPIDTDYPRERVKYILEDSSSKTLISHSLWRNNYATYSGLVLNVDMELAATFSDSIEGVSDHVEELERSTDDPAYIIYTSGSTGKPKGVVISHAAASNLVKAEQSLFKLKPTDKVAQGFSMAFDASIEEIWLAFASGAALFPVEKEIMCSGTDLGDFINQQKITVFSTVPTLLSVMPLQLPSLRLLILGGEECPHELLLRRSNKQLRIVNTYGPTEGTVITTAANFDPAKKITIGKPIANCAVFITDELLKPVSIGVPGELCIAGHGLAIGYHNNPDRTAEKFVTPPFALHNNFPDRIYRSGDLARMNEDGEIEFLGRIDTQVKLRGYRIELAEVESQILQLPNIISAAVFLKENPIKGSHLVACVVLKDKSQLLNSSSVKYSLRKRLASYMIPSVFVELDKLPLLPNGKTDRKKLLEIPIDSSRNEKKELFNRTEQKIFEVWSKYLSSRSISKRDDFFLDLGGHSLLAAKTVSELRLQSEFRNISVVDIYKNPTIEKLAKYLSSNQAGKPKQLVDSSFSENKNQSNGIRHFFCGVLQFLSFYFVFGFNLIRDFTPYAVFFYLYNNGYSLERSIVWAIVSSIGSYPVLITFAIGAKWVLLGRIKQGRYRLWGGFYLRWWLVRKLFQLVDFYYLAGTPLLPMVYRALGMTIGNDVHLETDHFAAFDQISIGDGTSIDEEATLNGFSVQDGFLVIGPIIVGKNCFIGTRSMLSENTIMEDGARLEDLSHLTSAVQIPKGETWSGSPAKCSSKINCAELIKTPDRSRNQRIGVTFLYGLLVCMIPVISAVAFAPGVILLMQFSPMHELLIYLSLLPLVGASFVLFLTLQVVIFKWLLVGKVKAGIYPVHGGFYVRNWIVDQLLRVSLEHVGQLHATLYVTGWYRALGMKIGRFVELSTAASSTPDLIHLEEGCTLADEVSLGAPHVEKGWMTLAPVYMGYRSFAGNSAVIPSGIKVGDQSLIGVLSIAPKRDDAERPHETWFGSPAILFPKREPSIGFAEEKTYKPSKKLRRRRGAFELLRITLPPAAFIMVAASVITLGLELWKNAGLVKTIVTLPLIFGLSCFTMLLVVAFVKWLVMGRYKPFIKPLWSNFVWRLEMVNALYEFFAAPLLLELLQGTPFLPWYLRLMGAKIGKQCYIDTTGFLEWDLVKMGDRVMINENAVMQTHLFEDRVLKASRLGVGDDCTIGACSVTLYDSVMKPGSKLDALSLLMKGEMLPEKTHWIGIPGSSQIINEPDEVAKNELKIIHEQYHEFEASFIG